MPLVCAMQPATVNNSFEKFPIDFAWNQFENDVIIHFWGIIIGWSCNAYRHLWVPVRFWLTPKVVKMKKKFFEIVRWHAALKVCKSPKMTAINRLSFFHGNLSWIFFCPKICLLRFVNNEKKNRLFCIETWGFDTFLHYNEAFILLCWVLALQLHFIWLLWTKEFAFGEKKNITKHIC